MCLFSQKEVLDILGGWNLEFDKSLHKFTGRVLPTEKIFQKEASVAITCDIINYCLLRVCLSYSSPTNLQKLTGLVR